MNEEWITLSTLGTYGGAVFTVTLVAQFLKGQLDRLLHIPTRILVLLIAWTVLLGHRYVISGDMTFEGLFLDALNGFMVALSAIGAHSLAKEKLQWK